jgi:hypothetical protein
MQVMDAGNELHGALRSVGIEAIPDQHARPLQFLVQMAGETADLRGADLSLGMQAKVKPRAIAAGRHLFLPKTRSTTKSGQFTGASTSRGSC